MWRSGLQVPGKLPNMSTLLQVAPVLESFDADVLRNGALPILPLGEDGRPLVDRPDEVFNLQHNVAIWRLFESFPDRFPVEQTQPSFSGRSGNSFTLASYALRYYWSKRTSTLTMYDKEPVSNTRPIDIIPESFRPAAVVPASAEEAENDSSVEEEEAPPLPAPVDPQHEAVQARQKDHGYTKAIAELQAKVDRYAAKMAATRDVDMRDEWEMKKLEQEEKLNALLTRHVLPPWPPLSEADRDYLTERLAAIRGEIVTPTVRPCLSDGLLQGHNTADIVSTEELLDHNAMVDADEPAAKGQGEPTAMAPPKTTELDGKLRKILFKELQALATGGAHHAYPMSYEQACKYLKVNPQDPAIIPKKPDIKLKPHQVVGKWTQLPFWTSTRASDRRCWNVNV